MAAAAGVVVAVRLGLFTCPYRLVVRATEGLARVPAWLPSQSATRIGQRVQRISARTPAATCLVQALAAFVLLAWHGRPSTIRYGVRRVSGELEAHAWVEHDGVIVVGGPTVTQFVRLDTSVLPDAR